MTPSRHRHITKKIDIKFQDVPFINIRVPSIKHKIPPLTPGDALGSKNALCSKKKKFYLQKQNQTFVTCR